jgi:hypothetical protein
MMRLQLSAEEARLLSEQLAFRLVELDRELVRTDQHRLQHALADDVRRLGAVAQRLETLLAQAGTS